MFFYVFSQIVTSMSKHIDFVVSLKIKYNRKKLNSCHNGLFSYGANFKLNGVQIRI